MRKSRTTWALVLILVITALLVGCGGGSQKPAETTSPKTTSTTATSQAKTTTSSTPAATVPTQTKSGDALSQALSRAQNISTLKYTMVVTPFGGPAMTTTVWMKKAKARMEMTVQGVKTISFVDNDAMTMYMYMPSQNIAMKVSVDQASKTATEEVNSIAACNPKSVGTESIGGIVCDIFEYGLEGGGLAKMWVSKDRGLPVRVEETTKEGKIIAEYKDYDFTDIPDSMFELPAGVQVMSSP